jgi:hypothetical protein
MVFRDAGTGQISVLESTNFTWTGISGVQLTPMGLWLDKYNGKVWVRRFIPKYADDANKQIRRIALKRFIRKYRGTSYPNLGKWSGLKKLFFAWWDGIFTGKNKDCDREIYCTECVARAFKNAGYMADDTNPAEFIPKDIEQDNGKFHKELINCRLGKARRIK